MRRPAALALAGLLCLGGGEANAQEAASEPTLMIVRLEPVYIGPPARCPGAVEEAEDEDSICIAELYQGAARVIRHISGPRVRNGRPFRFTAAHLRATDKSMTLLVVTVPFEDKGVVGNFAPWWHRPEADGAYCLEADDVEEMQDGPVRKAFQAGYSRRFKALGHNEKADFRCLRP